MNLKNLFFISLFILFFMVIFSLLEEHNDTALHIAASRGESSSIEKILDSLDNAQVNAKNKIDQTALHVAIYSRASTPEKKLKTVNALLSDHRTDPNIKEKFYGNTPLHSAAEWGDISLVKALLEKGANPNLTNLFNEKPSQMAKDLDVKKLLIEQEAFCAALHL